MRAQYLQDWLSDPETPLSWRLDHPRVIKVGKEADALKLMQGWLDNQRRLVDECSAWKPEYGVRTSLDAKGELPAESLMALMPISLRSDASAGGNEVAGVPVRVCSDIADPIERLQAVHRETIAAKKRGEKMGLDLLKNLLDALPSFVANGVLQQLVVRGVNLTVSNVRGPDEAIYLAGAKAMCLYPVSIPADGVGLNFTGVSYNGVMWVSMVSCRSMMPDPGHFLDCMRESWEELLAAADALPEQAPQPGNEPPAAAALQRASRALPKARKRAAVVRRKARRKAKATAS